jgi:hypothetical protein
MLADASISRADVSKAKPPAPRPAIRNTHAGRRLQRGVGKRRRWRRRCDIPAAGGRRRGGGMARGRRRGEIRTGGGESGGPPRRGWRCAMGMGRADVGATELTGGGRRRCARVGEEWRGTSERSSATRRTRGARRRRARREEAAATTTEEERRDLGENG